MEGTGIQLLSSADDETPTEGEETSLEMLTCLLHANPCRRLGAGIFTEECSDAFFNRTASMLEVVY